MLSLEVGTTEVISKFLTADVSFFASSFSKEQVITAAADAYCVGASSSCTGEEGTGSAPVASGFDSVVRVSLTRIVAEGEGASMAAHASPTINSTAVAAALGTSPNMTAVENVTATALVEVTTIDLGDTSDGQAIVDGASSSDPIASALAQLTTSEVAVGVQLIVPPSPPPRAPPSPPPPTPPPPPIQPLVSPSAPSLDELEEACLAAGFLSMGVAVGMMVAGLILGYLIGARDKLMKWLKKLSAPKEDKAEEDKGADGDEGDDAVEQDEETAQAEELLLNFMNGAWTSGLDDHPETEFNPILNYQIGKAKAKLREKKAIQALLMASGYDPNHMDTLDPAAQKKLLEELKESGGDVKVAGTVGSVAGVSRKYGATKNSALILHDAGARFKKGSKAKKAVAGGEDEEKKKAQEVRERLKTIDSHLAQVDDIDTAYVDSKSRSTLSASAGGLQKNALEVAKSTKFTPYGGDHARRLEDMAQYASRGRARVGAPLDHAITAKNERDRRGSTGVRRASLSRKKSEEEGGDEAGDAEGAEA